jgi:hypothetical protein
MNDERHAPDALLIEAASLVHLLEPVSWTTTPHG